VIAPIVELFNRSLAACHFPACYNEAFISPVIKKAGLDAADVRSYHPISNLSVLSKLLEHLIVQKLMNYLCQPPAAATVWFQTVPFNGDSCAKGSIQHSSGCRPRWCDWSGPPGPVSCIRHILLQRLSVTYGISDAGHTCPVGLSTCTADQAIRQLFIWCVAFRRDRCWDHFCLFSTPLASSHWSKVTVCHHTSTPTTHRLLSACCCWRNFRIDLWVHGSGGGPIGYSGITKRKFCGAWLVTTRLRQWRLDRQSVLNAAGWLIFNLRRSDHVSDALASLHWLRVPQHIRSTVAVLV